jgi:predicted RNA binding protein YcfA (HicA-like mRNA interferase family)
MSKLPAVTARHLLQAIQKAGFIIHHQTGSHVHLRHPAKPDLRLVIPYHHRDLAPKMLKHILVQAHLTGDDLLKLL